MDAAALRDRAARFRQKAAELQTAARAVTEPGMRDSYTALIAEYDNMAMQLERLADDLKLAR
jgi:hypothetical protein